MKSTVCIYCPRFLPVSETFIYRQLIGLRSKFNSVVLTQKVENRFIFPYDDVERVPRTLYDRAYSRFLRGAGVAYNYPSSKHIKQIKHALEPRDIRVVHAHFGPAGIYMLPVAQAMDIPLLVTFHGWDCSAALRDSLYLKGLRDLFRSAIIIAVSKNIRNRLLDLGAEPSKVHLHYIGVPLEAFAFVTRKPLAERFRDKETVRFLQVSRLVPKKGTDYTLKALARFRAIYADVSLTIVGDGSERTRLEALAGQLELDSVVEFVGAVPSDRVPELMARADVFLLHSVTASNGDEEGLPIVLMEAMASGMVVVSTRHAGIPELIRDEINGLLVEERNVDMYLAKLVSLMESPEDLPVAARSTVERMFNQSIQNTALTELYKGVH